MSTKSFSFKELDSEGFQTLEVISEAEKFNEWMYQTIAPYCHEKILEIGSGIGNISKLFIDHQQDIVLSDIRSNYCEYLQDKFNLGEKNLVHNLDLTDPQLTTKFTSCIGQFDSVFALNVVEHIEQDELAISNCFKLLKPGGTLVILVPAFNSLYNKFDAELGHYKRYSKKQLTNHFIKAGFSITKAQYFNAAGIVGWFVSGGLMKNKVIPSGQMKLYNLLVPIFKLIDRVLLNSVGLSVIVVGQKPQN